MEHSNQSASAEKNSTGHAQLAIEVNTDLQRDFWELLQTAFGSEAASEWTPNHRSNLLYASERILSLIGKEDIH